MKRTFDPFPDTPEGFHLRVEETLMGLEDKKMRRTNIHVRRLAVAIAAILILALGTAVAVVHGDQLRTWLRSGGEKLVSRVQDVHRTDADGDFSFTIHEALLEEETLYLSYTVSVPEDGNVYLFSPYQLRLNGRTVGDGLDAEFFSKLYALGGEYGAEASLIAQLQVDGENVAESLLNCKCVFMLAQRPLVQMDAMQLDTLFTEPDAAGNANQLMKNAKILYYTEADPVPAVYLHYYPEIRAIFETKGENILLAGELEKTGIAKQACMLELSLPIRESGGKVCFNDVTQHIHFMDGYIVEIEELSVSHFKTHFEAVIRKKDGGFTEWTEEEPFGQFYQLCKEDGSPLGTVQYRILGGDAVVREDGEMVYRISGDCGGVFPVEELAEIYLAPQTADENHCDMNRAIRLMPFNNPELSEEAYAPAVDPAEMDDLSS